METIAILSPQFDIDGNIIRNGLTPITRSVVAWSLGPIQRGKLNSAYWQRRGCIDQASMHRSLETLRDMLLAGF